MSLLLKFCVLMTSPNVATAWSYRKRSLVSASNALIQQELEFNRLILAKHVKCEQAYLHRRWLVKHLNADIGPEFIKQEIKLCAGVLSIKIKANYYCWSYLNWMWGHLLEQTPAFQTKIGLCSLLAEFLAELKDSLYVNPSDYCLFHTRLNLIKLLSDHQMLECFLSNQFQKEDVFYRFVFNELELVEDLLARYASYTSVWNYCKYFILYLEARQPVRMEPDLFNLYVRETDEAFEKNLRCSYLTDENFSLLYSAPLSNQNCYDALFEREIRVARLIEKTSKHESKTQKNVDNFAKFLNKFAKPK